eukprot:2720535-Pyramimonas_sp.AAC.1
MYKEACTSPCIHRYAYTIYPCTQPATVPGLWGPPWHRQDWQLGFWAPQTLVRTEDGMRLRGLGKDLRTRRLRAQRHGGGYTRLALRAMHL